MQTPSQGHAHPTGAAEGAPGVCAPTPAPHEALSPRQGLKDIKQAS